MKYIAFLFCIIFICSCNSDKLDGPLSAKRFIHDNLNKQIIKDYNNWHFISRGDCYIVDNDTLTGFFYCPQDINSIRDSINLLKEHNMISLNDINVKAKRLTDFMENYKLPMVHSRENYIEFFVGYGYVVVYSFSKVYNMDIERKIISQKSIIGELNWYDSSWAYYEIYVPPD